MARSLTTGVKCQAPPESLGVDGVICGIGSCFSERIVGGLHERGISGALNPNGIVYNTVSMADSLERVAAIRPYSEGDFFKHDGSWRSWSHHGCFARVSRDDAIEAANFSMEEFRQALSIANLMVLTVSSSVVYEFDGRIVANCHKVPNNRFRRRMLSVSKNLTALERCVAAVAAVNPDCRILLTLSPVRHYPGDLLLNSLSKANVLAAMGELRGAQEKIEYFPAYEIVMDELRDYRFSAEDMLHPSALATEIIFERFVSLYFTADGLLAIEAGGRRLKAAGHRRK